MIGMPPRDTAGFSVFGPATPGFSLTPNMRGIEGPVMSPSRMPTLSPRRFNPTASSPATSDFPTPPLPDITAMTCLMPFCSAMPLTFMPPPEATAVASGRPVGSLPVDAKVLRSRSSSSTFTRPPP